MTISLSLTEDLADAVKTYERNWLKPYIEGVPDWHALGHTRRYLAKEHKRFTVWRLAGLQPEILTKLHITNFACSLQGPTMLLAGEGGGIQVTHAPQELFPGSGVYLWIPALFDLRFAPSRYDMPTTARRLTWRFCVRMRSNPAEVDRRKIDQVFISDDEEFRRIWPNITC